MTDADRDLAARLGHDAAVYEAQAGDGFDRRAVDLRKAAAIVRERARAHDLVASKSAPKARVKKCKSCGAAIVWARVGSKTLPLNATRARVYELDETAAVREVGVGHVSHFISCPNASSHSKKEDSKP